MGIEASSWWQFLFGSEDWFHFLLFHFHFHCIVALLTCLRFVWWQPFHLDISQWKHFQTWEMENCVQSTRILKISNAPFPITLPILMSSNERWHDGPDSAINGITQYPTSRHEITISVVSLAVHIIFNVNVISLISLDLRKTVSIQFNSIHFNSIQFIQFNVGKKEKVNSLVENENANNFLAQMNIVEDHWFLSWTNSLQLVKIHFLLNFEE